MVKVNQELERRPFHFLHLRTRPRIFVVVSEHPLFAPSASPSVSPSIRKFISPPAIPTIALILPSVSLTIPPSSLSSVPLPPSVHPSVNLSVPPPVQLVIFPSVYQSLHSVSPPSSPITDPPLGPSFSLSGDRGYPSK